MDAFTQRIHDTWARKLDIPPEAFTRAGTHFFFKPPPLVRPNRALVYRSEYAAIVLLPDSLPASLRERVIGTASQFPATEPISEAELLAQFPLAGLRWRDIACYLRPEHREPPPLTGRLQLDIARRVLNPDRPADVAALAALNAALSESEREEGEVGIADFLSVGYYEQAELLAAASFLYDDENDVTDVGVIVHPAQRGRGLGQKVVRYLCSIADPSRLIQYRADEHNLGSLGVARGAGFTRFLVEEGYEVASDDEAAP